jgi:hypothetical protein
MSRSSSRSTGCTVRTTNGRVTNSRATTTPARVYARLTPSGLRGPYRASSTRPATIVGKANGRSMSPSTSRLPGKSSRTRTQAVRVPITRLINATPNEAATVSFSAAQASGVRTACQKAPGPCPAERHTTNASGMSTTRLRYTVAAPRPSPVPNRTRGGRRLRAGCGGRGCVASGSAAARPRTIASVDTGHLPH